jgi:hypothetical protein
MINKTNYNLWLLFSFGFTVLVITIYIYAFYNIGFFYDDYVFYREYSLSEIKRSLIGDWNFGQRLENSGFRPLANPIFHVLWILFGSNEIFYRLLSSILLLGYGLLSYNIFATYINNKKIVYLSTLLIVVFSDQFGHRIWLTELPSLLSSILVLYVILVCTNKKYDYSNYLVYICLLLSILIKDSNLPFILIPVFMNYINSKKLIPLKKIVFELFIIIIFVALFIYYRGIALANTPLIIPNRTIGLHSLYYFKEIIISLSEPFGMNKYGVVSLLILIITYVIYFVLNNIKNIVKNIWNYSDYWKILFILLLSTASFPFYPSGRLRSIFILTLILFIILSLLRSKIKLSYIKSIISFLIVTNLLLNFSFIKKINQENTTLSNMVYFSPYYRNFIQRGDATSFIDKLSKNRNIKILSEVYDKKINSLSPLVKNVNKSREFKDEHGITFIELTVGGEKTLNIMKYEFSEKFLNGFSNFYYLKGITDMPVQGAWRTQVLSFIKYLNSLSTKYSYRLPTSEEYCIASGEFSTIYNTSIKPFEGNNIDIVQNTLPNKYGICGLNSNVNEWTADDLDADFSFIFGGDSHFGSHNILFADQSQHADGHHTKLYGFRLVSELRDL